jgi:hypothetical protein
MAPPCIGDQQEVGAPFQTLDRHSHGTTPSEPEGA